VRFPSYLVQVHDEDNLCKVGDVVRFEACRPMSKSKRFVVKTIAGAAVYPDGVDGVGLKAK
jgi:ribosomal protein S17